MAAAPEVSTVWIGFMDFVPVIGTVKEAVELILALYEQNEEVIKEKNEAVENIVKASHKKYVKVKEAVELIFALYEQNEEALKEINEAVANIVKVSHKQYVKKSTPAAYATSASEYSGLLNVREVRITGIIEYVTGATKGKKTQPPAKEEEKKKKLEEVENAVLKKIHLIDPNFRVKIKEQMERSRRGEHVFNNDILRFHSKVLNDFIENNHISTLHGYNEQVVTRLGNHTLCAESANNIQKEMVVHFDNNEFYLNANAVLYSKYSSELHGALLAVLGHINPNDVTRQERGRVNFIIDKMNNLEIYVDELARDKWIGNNQEKLTRFQGVKGEVVRMFREDRGLTWCNNILHEVAPLFTTGQ